MNVASVLMMNNKNKNKMRANPRIFQRKLCQLNQNTKILSNQNSRNLGEERLLFLGQLTISLFHLGIFIWCLINPK